VTPQEKAKDSRLKRIYCRDLAWYNNTFARQHGGCAICGRAPGTLGLFVDHDHHWVTKGMDSLEILRYKAYDKVFYTATAFKGTQDEITASGKTKGEVRKAIKRLLVGQSVRGLLCMICNRKIVGVIERFKVPIDNIHAYLHKHMKGYQYAVCFVNGQGEVTAPSV
jgi:Recombination endonuclease VII